MSLVDCRPPIQHVAVVFTLILGISFFATAETPAHAGENSLAGTWKLNLTKSTYEAGPPPYKRSTCKIEFLTNGVVDGLKVIYDNVGIRGGVSHMEWVGKLDGKDYPIQGIDDALTNAYTRIDDLNYEVVVKADRVTAATARIVIAPDGKTLTSITTSRNSQGKTLKTTAVYDRQP